MLIVTARHTQADLDVWRDYEEVDAINSTSSRLSHKEMQAAEVIRKFAEIGPSYIGVSWGKDSVVVADIAMRHGINLPLVHLYCRPSHNINCDLVRDAFLAIYQSADYHEIICDYSDIYAKGLPAHIQDKFTDDVWYKTWGAVSSCFGDRHVSGVRGAESHTRSIRMKRWGTTTKHTCAPIGYWTTDDVYAYLHKYNLPVHPNYAMLGGGRWKREYLRVAEIGDVHGNGMGRTEWEQEYYSDALNRVRHMDKIPNA